uniref:Uncharacterized protein n=1 Tax=Meloidogyne hapla TaxID=6305 RepID=A0A1I8BFW6_MELHA
MPYFNVKEWQKQNNLNLKYINLTKLENLRRQNSTKFILIDIPEDWGGWCGGLANQIWYLAVLYVCGLQTNRYPGFVNNTAWTCDAYIGKPNEIEETFPVVDRIFEIFKDSDVKENTIFQENYNVTEMIKAKEKYLRIPPPPQIHELFKNLKNEVKELFLFSNKIRIIVDKYINEIFSNNSSHKLCIHTRLGDFGPPENPRHHPSRKDFSEESTKFVFNEIKPKRVFIPKDMPRGQDIYFSTKVCNSLIITASVSTFGWWIVYDFLCFADYTNLTKYSTIRPDLYFNDTEKLFNNIEQQKQLNLKYINLTEMENWRKSTKKFLLIEIPADWEGKCGGFANEMWRFAVIYVWGLQLGRYPGIFNSSTWTCDTLNLPNEIEETFPVVHKIFTYIQPNEVVNSTRYEIYYNKLVKSKVKYLRTPPPPQIHKLFNNVTNQVKELFLFSNKVKTTVDKYINEIFSNNSSHKLCIHTRLGDFGPPKYPRHHPSRKDFTEESTKFIFNEIKVNIFCSPQLIFK